jgi:hypothetical protein
VLKLTEDQEAGTIIHVGDVWPWDGGKYLYDKSYVIRVALPGAFIICLAALSLISYPCP